MTPRLALAAALALLVSTGCSTALRVVAEPPPGSGAPQTAPQAAPQAQAEAPQTAPTAAGAPEPAAAAAAFTATPAAAPAPARSPQDSWKLAAILANVVNDLETRDPTGRRQAAQRLATRTSSDLDPRVLEARALEVLGDGQGALDLWRGLASGSDPRLEALGVYSRLAVGLGKADEALAFVSARLQKDPKNADLQGTIGWLYLTKGEPGKARAPLEATQGTAAAKRYSVLLGRARLLGGDLEGAAEAARAGTAEAGNAPSAWVLLGDVQRARGLAGPAEEAYRKALALRPGDYAASVNLGVLRLSQGEAAEAESLFEAAARSAPGSPEALNNLGLARKARGDYPGAVEALEKALKTAPNFAPALKNLGILNEKYLGRPGDAVPCYDRYLAVRPGDPEVERWRKVAARLAEGEGK